MGAPTLAEFTTGAPAVSSQVFSKKDLRCLRIRALAAMAGIGAVVAVTDYNNNLANSSSGLVKTANDLLGAIPSGKIDEAITMMLVGRAGEGISTTTASALMSPITTLRECDNHELDIAEAYILALLMQSIGF